MTDSPPGLRKSYDLVASDYAAEYRHEMGKKPFDRRMLDWLAEKVGGRGIVCDLGCGPGQVAGYLHGRGVRTCGVDLSDEMVRQARRLHPEIPFEQADMRAMSELPDASWGGIAAFYSLIHVPRADIPGALRELLRGLVPGGVLLAAFHIGSETIHRDEWWGKEISIDFAFFETSEMKSWLVEAGFRLDEVIERDPYPEVEYPSRRAYVFASKES
ncbi:MAG: methyltransferase domain-containing protein [Acidobacteria bacterium]|nr:methyltransferase domain-containing protein [Acidobacteriota bacterium]MCA1611947.1 methyltransferase domain-containing protein [Acidobacteriota bacterium]